jgi:cytochrome c oxidase subunit 1
MPLVYLIWSLKFGKIAGNNPYNATGLEWQTPSPPPTFNFDVMPTISQPAYAYDTMECQGAPVAGVVAAGIASGPGTAH